MSELRDSNTAPRAVGSRYSHTSAVAGRMALGVFGAALLLVGAMLQLGVGVIVLAVLAVVLIVGWPHLFNIGHPNMARSVMVIVLLSALAVANWGTASLMPFVGALCVGGSFGAQMLRAGERSHMIEQASATCVGSMLIVMLAMWSFTWQTDLGRDLVIIFSALIALVAIIESLETFTVHILAFINASVAGVLLSWLLQIPLWVGFVAAMCVVCCYVVTALTIRNSVRPSLMFAGASRAVAPLCVLGMMSYAVSCVAV